MLLGAVGEGETRIPGFGRAGGHRVDARSGAGARRRGGRGRRRRAARPRRRAARPARARGGAIDAGNAGTLMRLLPGLLAGQEGTFTLTGDESLRSPPDGARRRAAAPDGRAGRDDGRPRARDRRRAARSQSIRYRPPMRERAGEVGVLLAGLYASGGETTVVEARADPRPHRADAPSGGRARDPSRQTRLGRVRPSGSSSARSRCPATSRRPRRSSSRRPCWPAPTCTSTTSAQPDPHRPARRARADGRAHRGLQPAAASAASRSATSRCAPHR